MASQQCNDAENLTTDACPSPPRQESESSKQKFKDEAKQDSAPYSRNKRKMPKPRKIPTQAVANVININNSNGIHIGSNYTINMGKPQKVEDNADVEDVIKTKEIHELMQRTDPVTKPIISFASEHIGKNWRVVVRTLGYSDGQIHQYYEKYLTLGVREVVYQILLDWKQFKTAEATVGILFTALWDAPEKDVVRRMADTEETN